jgi:predicted DCC family thiol-disulfide oxidoreductase YuxK
VLRLLTRLQAFLFAPVSAKGFGLMRAAWAGTLLAWFAAQWMDVTYFYSAQGVLPYDFEKLVTRSAHRFTILDWVSDPHAVFAVYLVFLAALFCAMIGFLPRLSTILSFALLCSFHEKLPLILGGGDTVLRLLGFLLCIAPTLSAFSVMRLRTQWKHWRVARTLLPDLTMSAWPYRLLLWQIIILYGTSVWYKGMGVMWLRGTAVTAALQQEIFIRWPHEVMRVVILFAPFMDYFAMGFEALWLLLLFPRSFTRWSMGWEFQPGLKRALILLGLLFHGGILVVMDVGSFSIAMFVAYLGLLLQEDFDTFVRFLNRRRRVPIRVFYDGHCGLCLRSIFWLQLLDWLGRLAYVDFRDTAAHQAFAPDLSLEALDKALHVRFPGPSAPLGASGKTLSGFDAFRAISWHLPPLWIAAPFLYIPGVPPIGRIVYGAIAARREKCSHEACAI